MKKTVATFRRPIPAKALEKLTEAFKITCGDDEVFIEQRGEFFAFYTVIFPEDRGEGWKKFERLIDEAQLHVGGGLHPPHLVSRREESRVRGRARGLREG